MNDTIRKVCYYGLPLISLFNMFFATTTAEMCAWAVAFSGWTAHLIELKSK